MSRPPRLDQPHWKVIAFFALTAAISVTPALVFRVLDWRACRWANLTDQEG